MDHKKISYERRAYESVDVRSIFGLYLIGLRKLVHRDSKGFTYILEQYIQII